MTPAPTDLMPDNTMKQRPDGFLSKENIDHDGEIFSYIVELHEILWKFCRAVNPASNGTLKVQIPLALADLVPRQADLKNEALEMQLQFLRQQYDGLVASNFKLSKKLAQRQAVTGDAHCEDCCCAKSWKALGITEYTGKSIPEHIEDLRGDNNILRLQRDAKMSSCGCNPAVPAEPTDKDAQLPSIEEVTEYFREHSPIGKAISSGELKVKVIPAEPTDKDAIAALNSIKEFIDHYSPTINTYDEEIETIRRALSAPAREGKLVEALNKLLDCEFEKVFRNAADVHRSYPAETKDAILNAREVLAAHDKETK